MRQNSQTPEPIDKKIGVGDYVGDDSQHAKFQNKNDRSIGGVVAYAWNITLAWILVFTERRLAKRGICRRRVSVCLCVCVCLSHSGIVSKRLNVGSRK